MASAPTNNFIVQILGRASTKDLESEKTSLINHSDKNKTPGEKDDDKDEKIGINWKAFFLFLVVLGLLIASLIVDALKNSKIWVFELWKWCLLLFVIIGGGAIAYMLMPIIVFKLICALWENKRVIPAYYLYGIRKSALFFVWLSLVFLTWVLLFDHGADKLNNNTAIKITNDVTRALAGVLIGAAIWLLKTLLVKLAASFHVEKFFEKFKIVKYKRQALIAISKKDPKFEEKMDKFVHAIRGRHLPKLCYGEHNEKIKDVAGARSAANEIFEKFACPDNEKYMNLENVLSYVKEENEDVRKHFQAIAQDKDIKRSDFRKWVIEVYREYNSLNNTLKYKKTAVDEFNKLASVVVLLVIMIVWLLFMKFITTELLIFIISECALVAFMFGNTAKTIFEALVFVFIQHPFDVGDRCVIDDVEMAVDEMELLTTTFLRYDGEKIYYPNSVLATKPISNLFRSPVMMDSVEFSICLPSEEHKREDIIKILKRKIKEYLEKNSRYWLAEHNLQFKEIENEKKMTVVLYVNHTISFQYASERGRRKSKLLLDMMNIFRERLIIANASSSRDAKFTHVGAMVAGESVQALRIREPEEYGPKQQIVVPEFVLEGAPSDHKFVQEEAQEGEISSSFEKVGKSSSFK